MVTWNSPHSSLTEVINSLSFLSRSQIKHNNNINPIIFLRKIAIESNGPNLKRAGGMISAFNFEPSSEMLSILRTFLRTGTISQKADLM